MHMTLLTLLIVCSRTITCGLASLSVMEIIIGPTYMVISMKLKHEKLHSACKGSLDLSFSYKVGFTCCSEQEDAHSGFLLGSIIDG